MRSLLEKRNKKNISVYVDASNIGSGGGITHLNNLLARAPSDNIIYTIWVDKRYLADLPKNNYFIYKSSFLFNLPFPMKFIWKILFFRFICFKSKPDIIFCPGGLLFFRHPNSTIIFQNILPFAKSSLFSSSLSERLKNKVLKESLKLSSSKSSKHIFHSINSMEVIYEQKASRKDYLVINHGIDDDFFIDQSKLEKKIGLLQKKIKQKECLSFTYVASAFKYKNHIPLLKVFRKLKDKGLAFNLNLVISKGPFKTKILKCVEDLSLKDEIKLYEDLNKKELISVLHDQTDLYLFVSSLETFGMILVEGMASGLPIFATKTSCIPEIIGEHDLYIDIQEIETAADKILKELNNLDKLIDHCNASFSRAKNFSWHNSAKMSWDFIFRGND